MERNVGAKKPSGAGRTWGRRANQSTPKPLVDPTASTLVSKLDAIAFLADRVNDANDDDRTARNRVRKALDDAIKKGQLHASSANELVFGELVTWARTKRSLADAVRDLPGSFTGQASSLPGQTQFGTPRSSTTPATHAELEVAYRDAQRRIHDLEQQVSDLKCELDRLRPDAEAYERVRSSARVNAGNPRPRRT